MSQLEMPYHLRPQKAVDRELFLEQLQIFGRHLHLEDYEYIGFGGPFFEDFKCIRSATPIRNFVSIESKTKVLARQEFNKPFNNIRITRGHSSEFIGSYEFEKPCIVWVDYSSAQLRTQLGEIYHLAKKMKSGDVLRVTLNANILNLGRNTSEQIDSLAVSTGDYYKPTITADDLNVGGYTNILNESMESALDRGVLDSQNGIRFEHYSSFAYQDTMQRMLTAVFVAIDPGDEGMIQLQRDEYYLKWFQRYESNGTVEIKVPVLSSRERIYIERLMDHRDPDRISRKMGGYISAKDIEEFITYHKHSPNYLRVANL